MGLNMQYCNVITSSFAELVVFTVCMASNSAESVVFWCEWLQFTLIGLLTTEYVTFMYVNYHALG